ncbi:hypothetical protein V1264_003493 [Littorina saxatilis]|uniref:G-protein coupled receptors family 1 profile domain-containing protein n=1 Tax=Littorina saxatilis TaxID=31220 RepID=A0AAN9B5Q9_9CAEN
MTTNITNTANDPYHDDGAIAGLTVEATTPAVFVESLTLVVLWLLSTVGNILVCLVVHRSRRIQSTTNFFVVSLAVSDLCVSVVCAPFVASRIIGDSWLVGQFFCKLVRFVQHAAPAATIFVLVSICIDRYYTIIYPLSFKVTRGTAKRMIVCSWVSASLISSLCFFFFEVVKTTRVKEGGGGSSHSKASSSFSSSSSSPALGDEVLVCPTFVPAANDWGGLTYIVVLVVCQFLLPVLIVCCLYVRVVGYIWTAGTPGVRVITRTNNPVPRAKVKMVKMLLVVTATTLAVHAPFYMAQLAYCFKPKQFLDRKVFIFAFWCLTATGTSKPLLYLYYNANFRRGCKEVFCMSAMRCYRSHTYAITTASMFGKKNYVGVMEINSNGQTLACDSPVKAFNRSLHVEKSAWPLNGSLPSTYV